MIHSKKNALLFFDDKGKCSTLSLFNYDLLWYVPITAFTQGTTPYFNMESIISSAAQLSADRILWIQVKAINDKVHENVCGHATHTYFLKYWSVISSEIIRLQGMFPKFKNTVQAIIKLRLHSSLKMSHSLHSLDFSTKWCVSITFIWITSVCSTPWTLHQCIQPSLWWKTYRFYSP